jgi:adenine-specific DNA-methyltransferase
LRPILRGRDIKKYTAQFAGLWVIVAKFGSHKYLENDYPVIYNHLLKYKTQLEKRGQCRYGGKNNAGMHHWLELDNCPSQNYLNDFDKPKIVWLTISDTSKFALDYIGYYCLDSTFFLTGKSIYLILSCLNSKLIEWYYDGICPSTGVGTNQWKKFAMEQIPIPILEDEKPFTILVKKIINNKSLNLNTQDLEIELNEAVYNIYGLTETEINYIKHIK